MNHIGQDWRKKHLAFVLESKTHRDKMFRDSWLHWLLRITSEHDQPLAKTLPHRQVLQRKNATFLYNQFGLEKREAHRMPFVCHKHAIIGNPGTRDWVPWVNMSHFTFKREMMGGNIMLHRVDRRGRGTDPHMVKGWEHRWNKVLEKNSMHYTRS